jgi:protein TonB
VDTASCQNSADYYPRQSQQLNESGTVGLTFFVETDGTFSDVKVERSSGYRRLDQAAPRVLATCKARPAMKEGKIERGQAKLDVGFRQPD